MQPVHVALHLSGIQGALRLDSLLLPGEPILVIQRETGGGEKKQKCEERKSEQNLPLEGANLLLLDGVGVGLRLDIAIEAEEIRGQAMSDNQVTGTEWRSGREEIGGARFPELGAAG